MKSDLVLLAVVCSLASVAGAEPKDAFGDPLPPGAKARLGTVRGGPLASSGRYSAAYLMPDGKAFLTAGEGGPALHDIATGRTTEIPGFDPRTDHLTFLAVSGDGRRVVTTRGKAYLVWEVNTGKVIQTVTPSRVGSPNQRGSPVSLSGDGTVMAFDDRASEVVVWDVEKNEALARITVLQNEAVHPLLSADGKRLATHGFHRPQITDPPTDIRPDAVVQLWNATTGKLVGTLSNVFPQRPYRTTVVFSADGATLATCAEAGGINPIRLWDVATGKEKEPILCRPSQGVQLAFSPDGKTLAAVAQDGAIDRWSLPDGKPLKATPFAGRDTLRPGFMDLAAAGLRFLDDDRVVAWGWLWGRAFVWDAPDGKLLTEDRGHVAAIRCVQFASQDRELVTTGDDYRILRWDPTGKVVGTIKLHEFRFRHQLHQLAPGARRALTWGLVFDLTTGEELFAFPFSRPFPNRDFARVAGFTASRHPKTDPTECEVWDTETRRRVFRAALPMNAELSGGVPDSVAALSPDGSRLVTAVRIRVNNAAVHTVFTGWDVKTGKKLGEFTDENCHVLTIAAASNTSCLITTRDGKLWTADYERGDKGAVIDATPPETSQFTVPTFSPEGKRFAAGVQTGKGREYVVRVYDWPQGNLLHAFTGHTGPVTALAFSSDGKTLASGSADGTVLLWDLRLPGAK